MLQQQFDGVSEHQWLFLVPLKGGIGGIFDPPIGRKKYHLYITYILPIGGLYVTYHLLGEPETTIENRFCVEKSHHESLLISIHLSDRYTYAVCLIVQLSMNIIQMRLFCIHIPSIYPPEV